MVGFRFHVLMQRIEAYVIRRAAKGDSTLILVHFLPWQFDESALDNNLRQLYILQYLRLYLFPLLSHLVQHPLPFPPRRLVYFRATTFANT
jgi:hypothetical protein